MRTAIKETKVYKFEELSKEAKEYVKQKYYENEEYPFLCEDLTESCKALLEEAGASYSDIRLLYSLSYSQGDGLCFTGTIEKGGKELRLTHNYRYYFANSVSMEFIGEQGEEVDEISELKDIYFSVCKKLEDEGYGILEYRMTDEEFSEFADNNEYEYTETGKLYF